MPNKPCTPRACLSLSRRRSRGGGTYALENPDETAHLTPNEKERAIGALRGLANRLGLPTRKGREPVAYRKISDEEKRRVEALLQQVKAGTLKKTVAQISVETGVSQAFVSLWASALDIDYVSGRPVDEDTDRWRQRIAELRAEDKTWREIAEIITAERGKKISPQGAHKLYSSVADKNKPKH